MKTLLTAAAAALVTLAIACGGGGGEPAPTSTPEAPPTTEASGAFDISNIAPWLRPAFDDDPRLPGLFVPPNPGPDGRFATRDDFEHFANGVRVPLCTAQQVARDQIGNCYHSNPPTSGPHAASAPPFRIHDTPVPKENLVHSMEHGGVVVWHNTSDQSSIALLREVVGEALSAGKLLIMSPYPDMEPETIAFTSWTRLDKFAASQLSRERLRNFIAVHERRFNPEGF
jgi:hypothetical protein